MQTLALIDYGSGNLRSAERALEEAAARAERRAKIHVTSDPDLIARADRIVLPGVGAFADCRAGLMARDGVLEALTLAVRERGVPFLGICVGMQLLADAGLEDVTTPGLGWIGGEVRLLAPSDQALRIPHMGWNTVAPTRPHPVLSDTAFEAYFVHSYAYFTTDSADCAASFDYGGTVTAAVARDNLVGVQFHPEKSQARGLALLSAFVDWAP
jgi:imidazole glycerol-phosphate synthase subunit HisH